MQVGGVHRALDGTQTIFVGRTIGVARLDSGAGQPHRVTGDVVIAAVGSLGGRLAAEFAAEEDQRFI